MKRRRRTHGKALTKKHGAIVIFRFYLGSAAYRETLHEDEQGTIESSVADLIHKAKRQRLADRQRHMKLGIVRSSQLLALRGFARVQMRHVMLIIDMSDAMLVKDMPPNRHGATCDVLSTFVADFFDYNPISQLGIVTTQNKRAKVLSINPVSIEYSHVAGNARVERQRATALGRPSGTARYEMRRRGVGAECTGGCHQSIEANARAQ